ncbi:hypothetical protein BN874_840034 [Candidatus Contendobacter odensis Run_B_J11]|uniref:Uncharacterized protein n=1 Tax=Candidatus Contendobacter odensis Run_B_J11 TaxID=1400861 RepID=A0A7U7J6B8_9GAMM|nr:hypothetical protein BN874_840034 [Candidatus Contendobacter odensis Run_B_J11]
MLSTASQGWASSYTVTDLDILGGTYSSAFGINKQGRLSGSQEPLGIVPSILSCMTKEL